MAAGADASLRAALAAYHIFGIHPALSVAAPATSAGYPPVSEGDLRTTGIVWIAFVRGRIHRPELHVGTHVARLTARLPVSAERGSRPLELVRTIRLDGPRLELVVPGGSGGGPHT
ncbi:hypothetical protein NDU88_003062 [Pleurodeles waltl]|uniref:Uncharacterized protein n=1 Tax=Pleurodeles waltl TaxID=8319 RepID=A0AAV7T457_PLEWA|nr:hypothetical protein NDU88_003062 [Pleurodeles waltl]